MKISKEAEKEIERLASIYTEKARVAKQAHDDLSAYVWVYIDEHNMRDSLDGIGEMIDLIPKSTVLLLKLYDMFFELQEKQGAQCNETDS